MKVSQFRGKEHTEAKIRSLQAVKYFVTSFHYRKKQILGMSHPLHVKKVFFFSVLGTESRGLTLRFHS